MNIISPIGRIGPICPIVRHSEETGESPAIITRERTYTYRQLDKMIAGAAAALRARGVKKHTRAALVGGNSVGYIAVLAALWRLGAVAVPLNFRFPPGYIKKITVKLETDYLFTENDFSLLTGSSETITASPSLIDLDNNATIILTSGSTSEEKAVLHTYANHYYNALGSNENIRLAPGDRWLLSLPLFHVGGLGILFRCFLAGATVVIPGKDESLAEVIRTYEITHVSLVSTQLARLLGEPRRPRRGTHKPLRTRRAAKKNDRDFPFLKVLLLGGSAFAPKLIEQAVEQGLPIHTTYGLSEMASQVTTTPAGVSPEKFLTSGKVLNYRDVSIDEAGEIRVKGRTLFKGYVDGGEIDLPLDEGGWFGTGDLGYFDPEGYLTVTGRKDNIFISGGENIMPEEIESILSRVPGIEQVVVVPVPDETYGFRPVAFLKIKDTTGITKESLIDYLSKHIPKFKIPDVFYLWPQGLESESLKIKRPTFQNLINKSFAGVRDPGGAVFQKSPLAAGGKEILEPVFLSTLT